MGNVIPTEARDAYLSRVAAIEAGIPNTTPAFNVNRLCGSGLQAIICAAQAILLGDAEVAIGGGAESMSRSPYIMPAARWGARMGDTAMVDYMTAVLHDPFESIHMGITAENVAARYHVTREMQDRLSVESQQRAARAIAAGRFKSQIVAVEAPAGKGIARFDTDECVRPDVTVEQLSKMKSVFKPGGLVTAGNSSGINDGAAALVLASGAHVRTANLKPLERRGFVTVAADNADKRTRRLTLTPAGRALLHAAVPAWRRTHAEIECLLAGSAPDRLRADLRALS